jgi:hypothetical protein
VVTTAVAKAVTTAAVVIARADKVKVEDNY